VPVDRHPGVLVVDADGHRARIVKTAGVVLIVPLDPLSPKRPDEAFAEEAAAADRLGVPVVLVDHDAWVAGEPLRLHGRIPEGAELVYRGWMVTAAPYERLAALVREQGSHLRTAPSEYRAAHELPGWYGALESVTPASSWTTGPDIDALVDLAAGLGPGPGIVRDYTKSEKHHWDEACFIPDLSDPAGVRRVATRFVELRDDLFVGGLVVRRYEPFDPPEARTWWRHGECVLQTPHPDTPGEQPPEPVGLDPLAPLISAVSNPFVTVDLARRRDGVWRVVELGDGQVSGRPSTQDAGDFLRRVLPIPPLSGTA
jgi:hypothetical protein